ncbi:MAG TPA: hypothetical protein VFB84_12545 [Micromonosporaceae bacterium]|nr:hypothetical protein [Micromonosporaceae bacterium]
MRTRPSRLSWAGWLAWLREVLAGCGVPVVELRWKHEHRLRTAVNACDALVGHGWRLA